MGERPQQHLARCSGILQADACGGCGKLYEAEWQAGAVLEEACRARLGASSSCSPISKQRRGEALDAAGADHGCCNPASSADW